MILGYASVWNIDRWCRRRPVLARNPDCPIKFLMPPQPVSPELGFPILQAFSLVDAKELAPMQELIDQMVNVR